MAVVDRQLGLVGGVAIKAPCRVATTANIALTGEQTIDGVAVVTSDRVLVKDQTDATENGIYVVDTGAWTRAKDFNGSHDVARGTLIRVNLGSTGQGFYYIATADPIVIGTTEISIEAASSTLAVTSAFAQSLLDDADAATARATLGSTAVGDAVFIAATAAAARTTLDIPATALSVESIAANDTLVAGDVGSLKRVTATATITLPAASALTTGQGIDFKSETTGAVLIAPDGSDTIDGLNSSYRLPSYTDCRLVKTGTGAWSIIRRPTVNVGDWMWAGQNTAPQGYVKAGTGPISRSTYASLFAVYGTTWGAGDGSTTFGIPDARNRSPIGAGTGTVTEAVTESSGNGFTVASNNSKWITGMPVVLSNLSGFTTNATAGPTYYVVRISATNVRLATTLALAQNGSPDITISGTGTATLTHTYTERTLGQYGGEESHAMNNLELLSHTHTINNDVGTVDGGSAGGFRIISGTEASGSTGGNAAMNIMNPYLVGELYIKT